MPSLPSRLELLQIRLPADAKVRYVSSKRHMDLAATFSAYLLNHLRPNEAPQGQTKQVFPQVRTTWLPVVKLLTSTLPGPPVPQQQQQQQALNEAVSSPVLSLMAVHIAQFLPLPCQQHIPL
jgi:hypothetical protein